MLTLKKLDIASHEEVHSCWDEDAGLRAIIAICHAIGASRFPSIRIANAPDRIPDIFHPRVQFLQQFPGDDLGTVVAFLNRMDRPLRHIQPNSTLEITTRTIQGRLLLRPSKELNRFILGILGRALIILILGGLKPSPKGGGFLFCIFSELPPPKGGGVRAPYESAFSRQARDKPSPSRRG